MPNSCMPLIGIRCREASDVRVACSLKAFCGSSGNSSPTAVTRDARMTYQSVQRSSTPLEQPDLGRMARHRLLVVGRWEVRDEVPIAELDERLDLGDRLGRSRSGGPRLRAVARERRLPDPRGLSSSVSDEDRADRGDGVEPVEYLERPGEAARYRRDARSLMSGRATSETNGSTTTATATVSDPPRICGSRPATPTRTALADRRRRRRHLCHDPRLVARRSHARARSVAPDQAILEAIRAWIAAAAAADVVIPGRGAPSRTDRGSHSASRTLLSIPARAVRCRDEGPARQPTTSDPDRGDRHDDGCPSHSLRDCR